MKYLFTSLLLLSILIHSNLQGQLQKGQWLLMSQFGGHKSYSESDAISSSFYSQSDKLYKPMGSINYFFAKSSSIGLGGTYQFAEKVNYSDNSGGGNSQSVDLTKGIAGNLCINQYFKLNPKFLLYVGLILSYQKSNRYMSYFQNDRETSYKKYFIDRSSTGINIGMMYVFKNRLAIQLNISGFEKYTQITQPENKSYKSIQNEWNTHLSNGLLSGGLCYFFCRPKS